MAVLRRDAKFPLGRSAMANQLSVETLKPVFAGRCGNLLRFCLCRIVRGHYGAPVAVLLATMLAVSACGHIEIGPPRPDDCPTRCGRNN